MHFRHNLPGRFIMPEQYYSMMEVPLINYSNKLKRNLNEFLTLSRFSVRPPPLICLYFSVVSCLPFSSPSSRTPYTPSYPPRTRLVAALCDLCSHCSISTSRSQPFTATIQQQQSHTHPSKKKRPLAPFANQLRAIWARMLQESYYNIITVFICQVMFLMWRFHNI